MPHDEPESKVNLKQIRRRYLSNLRDWLDEIIRSDVDTPPVIFPGIYPPEPWLNQILQRIENFEKLLRERDDRSPAQCPLSGSGATEGDITKLLVAPGQRNSGLKEIRDFTRGAQKLIIIDPYSYGGAAISAVEYAEEFAKAARFSSKALTHVHIIYNSRNGNTTAIKNEIQELARENKIILTDCDTDSIHDRVWIADRSRAIVVGTSFGGLGARAAFLLELPNEDLNNILDHLDEKGLSRIR